MLKWHPGRGRLGRSFATLDAPVQNFSLVNGNVLDINFKQLGSQISGNNITRISLLLCLNEPRSPNGHVL